MRRVVMWVCIGDGARIRPLPAEAPTRPTLTVPPSFDYVLSYGYACHGGHAEHHDAEEEIPVTQTLHGGFVRAEHGEGCGETRDAGDKGGDEDDDFHSDDVVW